MTSWSWVAMLAVSTSCVACDSPADPIAQASSAPPAVSAKYESKSGGYSIAMPPGVIEKVDTYQTNFGPAVAKVAMSGDGTRSFMVGFSEYEAPIDKITERLEVARDGMLKKMTAVLEQSEPIVVGPKHEGIDITAKAEKAGRIRARFFVVERRLYQMVVLAGDEATEAAFFDSLELTWKPTFPGG
jgi:hypothetical protein